MFLFKQLQKPKLIGVQSEIQEPLETKSKLSLLAKPLQGLYWSINYLGSTGVEQKLIELF